MLSKISLLVTLFILIACGTDAPKYKYIDIKECTIPVPFDYINKTGNTYGDFEYHFHSREGLGSYDIRNKKDDDVERNLAQIKSSENLELVKDIVYKDFRLIEVKTGNNFEKYPYIYVAIGNKSTIYVTNRKEIEVLKMIDYCAGTLKQAGLSSRCPVPPSQ